jgi:hypothetical protein
MEEIWARAKTTPLKMGQKYQSEGQGQGQKLMTKHDRAKISVPRARARANIDDKT